MKKTACRKSRETVPLKTTVALLINFSTGNCQIQKKRKPNEAIKLINCFHSLAAETRNPKIGLN
jgi:hypothetical protein